MKNTSEERKSADPMPYPAEGTGLALSELMRRGVLFSGKCPSRDVLKHLTSRWGVLVLITLLEKDRRFSELRRTIEGVSEKMLAQTLQTLEADGFVDRFSHAVVPPHVDYSLTPLGREVAIKVRDLADWIEVNIGRILTAKAERRAEAESAA